jgi:hypothetical protein
MEAILLHHLLYQAQKQSFLYITLLLFAQSDNAQSALQFIVDDKNQNEVLWHKLNERFDTVLKN